MAAEKNKSKDAFDDLVQKCPLRPIRRQKHYKTALAVCDELTDRYSKLNQDERDYLAVLTDFLVEYEESLETDEEKETDRQLCTPCELLKFLMENNKLSQVDLAPQFGSASRVSDFLNGKRELSKSQILKLAERFKVSPALFLEEASPYTRAKRDPAMTVSEGSGKYAEAESSEDDQTGAVRVNFRWTGEALSRVKRVAREMGMPFQAYIKQAVFRQVMEDERGISPDKEK